MPRETKEELDFGDFNLFTGGQEAFGTLNFCYSTEDFDRLSQLTEYNTRINLDLIKAEILRAIKAKQLSSKMSLKDIVKMKIMSRSSKDDFISLVRQMTASDGNGISSCPSSTSIHTIHPPPGSAGSGGKDGGTGAFLPPSLERFVSAVDLEPHTEDGEPSDITLRPHRPAERFVSAEDTTDWAPARPGAGTSR